MKIKSLSLKNFRAYEDLTQIEFCDLTAFVGKNDVGKSTILEALDIFFNDNKGIAKIDKTDVNANALKNGDDETMICVCFSNLPRHVIIDSLVETSLDDEYLLNREGDLEVVKRYRNGSPAKTYIRAKHPTNPRCSELLLKKNNELKRIISEEGIESENQAVNAIMRKEIWTKYQSDLQLDDVEIEITKEDAKKIWEKLSGYLPLFSLFQADRKNSDGDTEIQDPLKEAVKQILSESEILNTLSDVAKIVEDRLREVSNRTLEKLREMDPAIADSLNPVLPPPNGLKWQDVFKNVSISGDNDIPINKRGSGVKRLVLLNFFRAEAERRANDNNNACIIYAIEEPETSQHTNNQLILIDALKSMAHLENTQIIITTHSANIVKQLDFDNLKLVKTEENHTRKIANVDPGQLHYPSLNEVNYVAFNEVTEEYHNELYSFIELQEWKEEFVMDQETRKYLKQCKNGQQKTENKVLSEYIRHQIHHPENTLNIRYTKDELAASICLMRSFIGQKNSTSKSVGIAK